MEEPEFALVERIGANWTRGGHSKVYLWSPGQELSDPIWQSKQYTLPHSKLTYSESPSQIIKHDGILYVGLNTGAVQIIDIEEGDLGQVRRFTDFSEMDPKAIEWEEGIFLWNDARQSKLIVHDGKVYDGTMLGVYSTLDSKLQLEGHVGALVVNNGRLLVDTISTKYHPKRGIICQPLAPEGPFFYEENPKREVVEWNGRAVYKDAIAKWIPPDLNPTNCLRDVMTGEVIVPKIAKTGFAKDYLIHGNKKYTAENVPWPPGLVIAISDFEGKLESTKVRTETNGFALFDGMVYDISKCLRWGDPHPWKIYRSDSEHDAPMMDIRLKTKELDDEWCMQEVIRKSIGTDKYGILLCIESPFDNSTRIVSHLDLDKSLLKLEGEYDMFYLNEIHNSRSP